MYKSISLIALTLALVAPGIANAATIDSSLIPDGTYTVTIEKVVDSKHVTVKMDNGAETTLAAGRDSVDFSKIKASDSVKLSIIKGTVMVYLDLSSH